MSLLAVLFDISGMPLSVNHAFEAEGFITCEIIFHRRPTEQEAKVLGATLLEGGTWKHVHEERWHRSNILVAASQRATPASRAARTNARLK